VGLALNSNNYSAAYHSVKFVCTFRPYSIPLWNLFNKVITKLGSFVGQRKFIIRLLLKHQDSIPLMILVGNYCFMVGRYRHALGEYFRAYKALPNEPVINLCIGLAYLHQSLSRSVPHRQYCVMQAFCFLFQYYGIRNKNQEANYNLARAFHQLGLVHLALPFYERVLQSENSKKYERTQTANTTFSSTIRDNYSNQTNDADIEQEPDYDLKREAAFNLSLIYRASGNDALARQILRDYVVI